MFFTSNQTERATRDGGYAVPLPEPCNSACPSILAEASSGTICTFPWDLRSPLPRLSRSVASNSGECTLHAFHPNCRLPHVVVVCSGRDPDLTAGKFEQAMKGRTMYKLPKLVLDAKESASDPAGVSKLPGKGSNFVTIGVVVRQFEAKNDSKGNRYKTFHIGDLGGTNNVSVMLYNTAMVKRSGTPLGSVVALLTPSILPPMPDAVIKADYAPRLVVRNEEQLLLLGTAKDYKCCSAVRDGRPCDALISIFEKHEQFCSFHRQKRKKHLAPTPPLEQSRTVNPNRGEGARPPVNPGKMVPQLNIRDGHIRPLTGPSVRTKPYRGNSLNAQGVRDTQAMQKLAAVWSFPSRLLDSRALTSLPFCRSRCQYLRS